MEAFQVVKMSFEMEYNETTLKTTIFFLFPFSRVKKNQTWIWLNKFYLINKNSEKGMCFLKKMGIDDKARPEMVNKWESFISLRWKKNSKGAQIAKRRMFGGQRNKRSYI